jgi:hypothetical protein
MGWAQDLASLPLKALVNWGKPAPEVNYGAVTKRSEYGNPDDIVGNIGYDARNFVAGVGKTSPLLEPISKIPLVGPALAVTTGILGGAWSAATGGEEQRQNRQAEAEAAKIVRDKYLANEEFLNQTEREQLAKLNEYIKRLEQSYQNQLGLQAGLLARQMQANQQAYGSQLGSVGMGYAASQPKMMRDLAARGMLGTGAEAVARGALAGQRAYDVAKAMQNFEAQNAKYYEADIGTRSDFLSRFNQGENQLTKARADLNTALREARLENQQGNVDAAAKLSQQFRKDAGESVQKRNEDIFQGAVNLVSSGAFQSAMGSAFGSLNNAAPEAVGEAWKSSGQGLSGAFRDTNIGSNDVMDSFERGATRRIMSVPPVNRVEITPRPVSQVSYQITDPATRSLQANLNSAAPGILNPTSGASIPSLLNDRLPEQLGGTVQGQRRIEYRSPLDLAQNIPGVR